MTLWRWQRDMFTWVQHLQYNATWCSGRTVPVASSNLAIGVAVNWSVVPTATWLLSCILPFGCCWCARCLVKIFGLLHLLSFFDNWCLLMSLGQYESNHSAWMKDAYHRLNDRAMVVRDSEGLAEPDCQCQAVSTWLWQRDGSQAGSNKCFQHSCRWLMGPMTQSHGFSARTCYTRGEPIG